MLSRREQANGSYSPANRRAAKRRQLNALLVSLAVVAILAIVGAFLYQTYLAPFRRPVMTVDNTVVRMDYFLKRARLAANPTSALESLANEQVINIVAKASKLEVTRIDIERAMRSVATNSAINDFTAEAAAMTEKDFKEWFAQELKSTGLSGAEYRDMIKTGLLAAYIQEALGQEIKTSGEQVYLNVIVLATSADADRARARIASGESFAAVAASVSLDAETKELGGAVGWVPRGILPYDDVIFALEAGQVSNTTPTDPSNSGAGQFLVFMVSEKATDRPIDESSMQKLKSKAFSAWLTQEMPQHKIEYLLNESDQAWVELQLAKRAGN